MSVRHHPKDPKKWIIDYYPQGRKGKQVKRVFEGTEADARAWELTLRRGSSGVLPNPVNPKIADIIPEYLEWLKMHRAKTTYEDVVRTLKTLIPHFGHLQVTRITQAVVNKYKQKRAPHARATNKELDYLKGIIKYMVKNNFANPLSFKIEEVPYNPPLPQVPHPDDFQKFLAEVKDHTKKAMILLKWTAGLRWKEVSNLRWENIDFASNTIYLKDTKGNTPGVCVLVDEVRNILESIKRENGFVFVNPKTNQPYRGLHKLFRAASRRAGIKRIKPHLLRHAFGTYLLEATGDLRLVQEALRHKDVTTTTIYTHIAVNRLRDGISKATSYTKNMESQKNIENKGNQP